MLLVQLPSYSLKEVSKTVLPESGADNEKVDLPPKEIFRLFREGDAQGITQVAEYCVQDTALPLKIANTLCTVGNAIEMAKCSCVPVDYLLKRGMQIKVFSLILKYTMSLGYVIPVTPRDNGAKRAADDGKSDKYEGATVLDAKSDVYMRCIVTLDFASLYPRQACYTWSISCESVKPMPAPSPMTPPKSIRASPKYSQNLF
jgi:DNA polymerase delta subunit 1